MELVKQVQKESSWWLPKNQTWFRYIFTWRY